MTKRKRTRTPVATAPTPATKGHALSDAVKPSLPVGPYVTRSDDALGTVSVTDTGRAFVRLRASEGASQSLIASELGITKSTLKQCFERDDEVRVAWEHGAAELENELVLSLVVSARGGYAAAAMFLLKCRFGYRENDTPTDNRPNVIIHLPDAYSPDDYMRSLRVVEQPAREKVTRPVKALPSGNGGQS